MEPFKVLIILVMVTMVKKLHKTNAEVMSIK